MKKTFFTLVALILFTQSYAQQTMPVKTKLWDRVVENYEVLTTNKNIKHGLYQALKGKTAVASGMYKENKRVGTWHFYNQKGSLVQNFNYDKMMLTAMINDSLFHITYTFDKPITDSTVATRPIRVGGSYYGYLPYLALFHLPKGMEKDNYQLYDCVLQLLISPGGRLAEYKITMQYGDFYTSYTFNTGELDPYDTIFLPATINGENVASTILILCRLQADGKLMFVPLSEK